MKATRAGPQQAAEMAAILRRLHAADRGEGEDGGGGSDDGSGDAGGSGSDDSGGAGDAALDASPALRALVERAAALGGDVDAALGELEPALARELERLALAGQLSHLVAPWQPWWQRDEVRELQLNAAGQRGVTALGGAAAPAEQPGCGLPAPPAAPLPSLAELAGRGFRASPLLPWALLQLLVAYSAVLRWYNGEPDSGRRGGGDAGPAGWEAAEQLVALAPPLAAPAASAGAPAAAAAAAAAEPAPDSARGARMQLMAAAARLGCLPGGGQGAPGGAGGAGAVPPELRALLQLATSDALQLLRLGRPCVLLALTDAWRVVEDARAGLKQQRGAGAGAPAAAQRALAQRLKLAGRKLHFHLVWANEQPPAAFERLAAALALELDEAAAVAGAGAGGGGGGGAAVAGAQQQRAGRSAGATGVPPVAPPRQQERQEGERQERLDGGAARAPVAQALRMALCSRAVRCPAPAATGRESFACVSHLRQPAGSARRRRAVAAAAGSSGAGEQPPAQQQAAQQPAPPVAPGQLGAGAWGDGGHAAAAAAAAAATWGGGGGGHAGLAPGAAAAAASRVAKYRRIMLKVSGEAIAGARGFGMDPSVLEAIAAEIQAARAHGIQIAVVVGGGNYFRGASAWEGMERATADNVGMLATVMNALCLQAALENLGVTSRVQTAIEMREVAEPYIRRRAIRHLENGHVVIFGGGTGNPYFTTDTAAALRAAEVQAEVLLKATKVDGIFSCDPAKHPDKAQRYERLSYRQVTSQELGVMDETAVTLCKENNIPVIVFNAMQPGNIVRAAMGDDVGTVVTHADEALPPAGRL
ncbi:pyrH [Scenedesmus sp. PABB004]|nr:pyrH [Scenedesmus sp. PABB004]